MEYGTVGEGGARSNIYLSNGKATLLKGYRWKLSVSMMSVCCVCFGGSFVFSCGFGLLIVFVHLAIGNHLIGKKNAQRSGD